MAPSDRPADDHQGRLVETDEAAPLPHYHGHRERLRARFRDVGSALPDYEILELLLTLAIPRRDVKPLAKSLIAQFGSFAGVISAPIERLDEVEGLGQIGPVALKLVREAALRLAATEVMNRPAIASWTALIDYCTARLSRATIEEVRVLYLDRKNYLIADEAQGRGTVDQAPLYIREVVKRALALDASAVILVHNHPSGDPTPSKADIAMTRDLAGALKTVGLSLHDHLVIARERHASFKTLGLL